MTEQFLISPLQNNFPHYCRSLKSTKTCNRDINHIKGNSDFEENILSRLIPTGYYSQYNAYLPNATELHIFAIF